MLKFLYQFDQLGNIVDTHVTVKEASIKTNFSQGAIRNSIKSGSIVANTNYFSHNKGFVIPIKKKPFREMISSRKEYLHLTEK